jgi:hypothetical protein
MDRCENGDNISFETVYHIMCIMPYKQILFSGLIILFGCGKQKSASELQIDQFKTGVSDKVFKNFPLAEDEMAAPPLIIIYPESMYASGYCGLFISRHLTQIDFTNKKKELIALSKAQSGIVDSCNVYVTTTKSQSRIKCGGNVYPLPNVDDEFAFLRDKSLDPLSTYLVFESQSGKFVPDEYLMNSNKISVQLGHGFSNGAILHDSDNEIIYWVIIW